MSCLLRCPYFRGSCYRGSTVYRNRACNVHICTPEHFTLYISAAYKSPLSELALSLGMNYEAKKEGNFLFVAFVYSCPCTLWFT